MAEKKYANVGGQAIIEGIMMKSPINTVIAVRKPDGEIEIRPMPVKNRKSKISKWPIIRGVIAFVSSLITGYKSLMISAEIAGVDEDSKNNKEKDNKFVSNLLITCSAILGVLLAIGLFIFVPTLIVEGLSFIFGGVEFGAWKILIQGIIRILIFLVYIIIVSKMKDIHRLFQYHGAEHKTIFCFEAREELTVENVRKQIRFHPRCGTSFILLVLVISIIFYSLITLIPCFAYLNSSLPYVYMLVKLLFLPIVAGVSFEFLRYAGRNDNWFIKIMSAPGLAFQHITTAEPDDSQIEVGIESLKAALINPDTGEPDYEAAYKK